MRRFDDPQDALVITGRGIMFSASHWRLQPGEWEPWDLRGEYVLLDGKGPVQIIGVEAFCVHRSPDHPYRHPLAPMFREKDLEDAGIDYRTYRTQK